MAYKFACVRCRPVVSDKPHKACERVKSRLTLRLGGLFSVFKGCGQGVWPAFLARNAEAWERLSRSAHARRSKLSPRAAIPAPQRIARRWPGHLCPPSNRPDKQNETNAGNIERLGVCPVALLR